MDGVSRGKYCSSNGLLTLARKAAAFHSEEGDWSLNGPQRIESMRSMKGIA